MRIARKKLIKFYDEKVKNEGRGSDVAALTALWGEDLLIGMLQHYWKRAENAESEIISYSCSAGKKSGSRLDAWLLKRSSDNDFLYQVEIKNWAAYSIGGKELAFEASEEHLREYCSAQWHSYFGEGVVLARHIAKALEPMKKPLGHEDRLPISLLCFWFYISESVSKPFSHYRYPDGKQLHVFSASAYLRSLTDEFLDIPMPRVDRRLKLLSELTGSND